MNDHVSVSFSKPEHSNKDGTYLLVVKYHRLHSPQAGPRVFSQEWHVLTKICLAEGVQANADTIIRPNIRRDAFAFTQDIGYYASPYPTSRRLVELRPADMRNMSERGSQVLGYCKS